MIALYLSLAFILLLIVLSTKYNKNSSNEYLSIRTTKNEQGICALLLVIHHLVQNISAGGPVIILKYIGFILVAVFFFISGYGLQYSYSNKENYLSQIYKKRIPSVLIPYEIANILLIVYYAIKGVYFTPTKYILSVIGIDTVTHTWFVTAILIIYILFYISFKVAEKFSDKKIGYIILTIGVILYIIICALLDAPRGWNDSVLTFLLGIYWHKLENYFVKLINKHYILSLMLSIIIFSFAFGGRLILQYLGITNDILHIILRNLVSILFVLLMLTTTQRFTIKGKLIDLISNYSYELYITHYILILVLSPYIDNSNLFVLVIFILSVLSAVILNWCSKKILKKAVK